MIRLSDYDLAHPKTWNEATGDGWCKTHDPQGRFYFGVDLSVDGLPEENITFNLQVVDALMLACGQLVVRDNVRYAMLGSRMPYYRRRAHRYPDPEVYMRTKYKGRYIDPQVNMYSRVWGLKLMCLIPDYFDDADSLNNGVLWRWRNPFYRIPGRKVWSKLLVKFADK